MGEKTDELTIKLATVAVPIAPYVRVNEEGNVEHVDAHIRHIEVGLPDMAANSPMQLPGTKQETHENLRVVGVRYGVQMGPSRSNRATVFHLIDPEGRHIYASSSNKQWRSVGLGDRLTISGYATDWKTTSTTEAFQQEKHIHGNARILKYEAAYTLEDAPDDPGEEKNQLPEAGTNAVLPSRDEVYADVMESAEALYDPRDPEGSKKRIGEYVTQQMAEYDKQAGLPDVGTNYDVRSKNVPADRLPDYMWNQGQAGPGARSFDLVDPDGKMVGSTYERANQRGVKAYLLVDGKRQYLGEYPNQDYAREAVETFHDSLRARRLSTQMNVMDAEDENWGMGTNAVLRPSVYQKGDAVKSKKGLNGTILAQGTTADRYLVQWEDGKKQWVFGKASLVPATLPDSGTNAPLRSDDESLLPGLTTEQLEDLAKRAKEAVLLDLPVDPEFHHSILQELAKRKGETLPDLGTNELLGGLIDTPTQMWAQNAGSQKLQVRGDDELFTTDFAAEPDDFSLADAGDNEALRAKIGQAKRMWMALDNRMGTSDELKQLEESLKNLNAEIRRELRGESVLPDEAAARFVRVTDRRAGGRDFTFPNKGQMYKKPYPFATGSGVSDKTTEELAKRYGVSVASLDEQARLDWEKGGRDTYGVPSASLNAWRIALGIKVVNPSKSPEYYTQPLPDTGTNAAKKKASLASKFAPTQVESGDPDLPPHELGSVEGVKRPSDAVTFTDTRKVKGEGLDLNKDILDEMMLIVGIKVDADTKIDIVLTDAHEGEYGVTQEIGPKHYRVGVKVLSKEKFSENAKYVLNNSLLHELRHVTQIQHKPGHLADYQKQNATVGYQNNKYELDARLYGRLADHTGTKDTGVLGPAIGNELNALTGTGEPGPGTSDAPAPSMGGLGGLTINAPEADPVVEEAKAKGTADGEKEVEALIPMSSEERVKTVAQAKIDGLKMYAEAKAEQNSEKFAQSEYLRRKYKVLRTALKDGEKEQVDALVAESGVSVPEHAAPSGGGDLLGAIMQMLMGGGGAPSAPDPEVEQAKVDGDADGQKELPGLAAMSSEERVKAVAQAKMSGIKLAVEAQAEQDHAKFVQSEYMRRRYKVLRTGLQGDEKAKVDAIVEQSGLKVPSGAAPEGGAGPNLQALLGGGAPMAAPDPEVEEAKAKGTIEGTSMLESLQAMDPEARIAAVGQVKIDGLKMATEADNEQDHDKFVQSEFLRRKYKAMRDSLLEGEKEQMDAWVGKSLAKVPDAAEPSDGGLLDQIDPATNAPIQWKTFKSSLRQKSVRWDSDTWNPTYFGPRNSQMTFAEWVSAKMDEDLPTLATQHFPGVPRDLDQALPSGGRYDRLRGLIAQGKTEEAMTLARDILMAYPPPDARTVTVLSAWMNSMLVGAGSLPGLGTESSLRKPSPDQYIVPWQGDYLDGKGQREPLDWSKGDAPMPTEWGFFPGSKARVRAHPVTGKYNASFDAQAPFDLGDYDTQDEARAAIERWVWFAKQNVLRGLAKSGSRKDTYDLIEGMGVMVFRQELQKVIKGEKADPKLEVLVAQYGLSSILRNLRQFERGVSVDDAPWSEWAGN